MLRKKPKGKNREEKQNMNKMKKFALIAVCALLLVCVTIGATIAWLTSNDQVTNTFTVGKVAITLDEAKVDNAGKEITGEGADRVKENEYHLLPGSSYDKDPTVHVEANSEDSYIFVQVTNDIAAIIDASIEKQITETYGWTKLEEGVYYKEYTKNTTDQDYIVFKGFKVKDTASNDDLAAFAPVKNEKGEFDYKTITVKAYAIQQSGCTDEKDAWAKVSA